MKLKNNEIEKKGGLINRVSLETQLEELLVNQLEEMNKQLIVYMPLMILCMLKVNELKKMLKEQVLLFVLQLLEIMLVIPKYLYRLIITILEQYLPVFQFSVSGPGFSVLVPEPGRFNSLYRASGSLKMKK